MQAKFVNRLTMSRKHGAQTNSARALKHLPDRYLPANQPSILDIPVPPEEAAAEARAKAKAKVKARHPLEPKGPPPRHDRWQRHERRGQWQERASSGSQYYRGNCRWRNDQWDR